MNRLNEIDANINPCGIPLRVSRKKLNVLIKRYFIKTMGIKLCSKKLQER